MAQDRRDERTDPFRRDKATCFDSATARLHEPVDELYFELSLKQPFLVLQSISRPDFDNLDRSSQTGRERSVQVGKKAVWVAARASFCARLGGECPYDQ